MISSHPKRLTPPAPIGSMLKRQGILDEKQGRGHDPDHLKNIRQLPCLYCGVEPCGEAAHVSFSNSEFGRTNSFGRRAKDSDTVPLCRDDHLNARQAQHRGNEEAFWTALGIQPYAVAKQLYAQRGDIVAMRAIVMVAIANRSKT